MNSAEIKRLLPDVYQRAAAEGSLLQSILDVMQMLHEPGENVIASFSTIVDPRTTDERFLPMLAYWVNLDRLFSPLPYGMSAWSARPSPMPAGRLRELISSAAELSRLRGTLAGLVRFLEIATGLGGFTIDEAVAGADGLPVPFHIVVTAPAEAEPYFDLVERIVEQERPAHLTFEVKLADATSASGRG